MTSGDAKPVVWIRSLNQQENRRLTEVSSDLVLSENPPCLERPKRNAFLEFFAEATIESGTAPSKDKESFALIGSQLAKSGQISKIAFQRTSSLIEGIRQSNSLSQ